MFFKKNQSNNSADFYLDGKMKNSTSTFLRWDNVKNSDGYNVYDGRKKLNSNLIKTNN